MPTARKLPSGSWRCQVFSHYETVDGKKKRIYKSFTSDDPTRKGKAAAEAAAARYRMSQKEETHADISFGEAADQYIENIAPVISVRTVRSYRDIRRLYLTEISRKKISDLTQDDVQAVVNKWSVALSPKTIRNIHGFISAVLSKYRPNFALRTVLPKKVRPDLYIPTDGDIKRLMAFCKGTDLELPILLAAFGPMRRGEICALDSKHVKGNTAHVCQSLVLDTNGKWVLKQPKSYAGDRFIEYPDFVAEKWAGLEGRFVKCTPNTLTKNFAKLLKAAGLPHFRFHDLRHYSASIQHALGIPDSYIMQRGGWSTDSTLKNVYRHALDDKAKEMNSVANQHFSGLMQHEMQHDSSEGAIK